MELINPSNLTGKHIEVTQLTRNDSETYLRLKRSYTLYDLQPLKDRETGYYSGHMVVREREFGKYRDDFPACIYIPDPEELSKGYVFHLDEYGDDEALIYDNDWQYIRLKEDEKVKGVNRYRRFAYLWDYDFIYRISFVEKPDDLDFRLQSERAERALYKQGKVKDEERRIYLRKLDPLCRPVNQLGLPISISNELMNAGIMYSTDLKNTTMMDFSKIPRLNRTDIEQCIVQLRKAGYKISMF